MRITIHYSADSTIKLPKNYNEIIQGFIYRNLEKSLANFIHNEGFKYEKRNFKLFTFSRIFGKIKANKNQFLIQSPFKVVVSSPYNKILISFANSLLTKDKFKLGNYFVNIDSIDVESTADIENESYIYFLSPITVYSTFEENGKKKTYYYNPKELKFSELVRENLIKKYIAFFGKTPDDNTFNIEPVKVLPRDEKIVFYKGFIIKGWMGHYKISGSQELLKFAYDVGLGSKNSQGFGCFEVINKNSTILAK